MATKVQALTQAVIAVKDEWVVVFCNILMGLLLSKSQRALIKTTFQLGTEELARRLRELQGPSEQGLPW